MAEQSLQGTMTQESDSPARPRKAFDPKRRKAMLDMLASGEDAKFVKFNHVMHGFDEEEADDAINTFYRATGQPNPIANQTTIQTEDGRGVTSATAMSLGESEAAMTFLQGLDDLVKDKKSDNAFSPIEGQLRAQNPWDTEVLGVQAQINATKQIVGKYLEGGVLRAEDEKKYEKILPKIGDTKAVAEYKVGQVRKLVEERKESQIKSLEGTGFNVAGLKEDGTETLQTPQTVQSSQDDQAYQWLQSNPNDPMAKQVKAKLESNGYFQKQQEQSAGEVSQTPTGEPLVNEDGIKYTGFFDKALDKAAEFTGVKKFGEGIGTTLFLQTKEGKDLQAKVEQGDEEAIKTMQGILDEAPSAKELIGSAALTVLNIASAGLTSKGAGAVSTAVSKTGVGAKVAKAVGTLAAGTGTGYAYDVAGDLERDKTVAQAATPGLGTLVGLGASATGVGLNYLKDKRLAKLPDEAKKAVGKIVQGETKDVEPALRVLNQIDPKGIKSYADLSARIDDNKSALGAAMDDILAKDQTKRKLSELTQTSTVGGKKVSENYIKRALEGLDELYTNSVDPKNAQRIKNLIEKSETSGLNNTELNQIAKEYGRDFGKKAFTATGEPRTSVSGIAYENVRSGVKDTVRSLLPDDKAKLIDKNLSEHIKVQDLVNDMVEKTNKLNQRVNERGLLEKVGRAAGKTVDIVSGGSVKGFLGSLLPSNVGLKTMNAIDLQKALGKNLKTIDKAETLLGNEKFISVLKKKTGKLTLPVILNAVREFSDE